MECKFKKQGCGGCQMSDTAYSDQLALKQKNTEKLLRRFGKVRPIIGMQDPMHYRCKVISSFGTAKDGSLMCGLYAGYSHKVLPIADCLLEDRRCAEVVQAVRQAAARCRYTAFDEDRGTGLLRHVLVRRGFSTGQIMVVLVTVAAFLPSSRQFVNELRRLCPDITTIVQNINSRKTSVVLGDTNKVLHGQGYIDDRLCGCSFMISPASFYQVNPAQTEVLYRCAIDLAELTGKETVLDAYCGTGTIGIAAAKRGAAAVAGVESNGDAVHDAIRNSNRNRVENIRFYKADAGRFLQQLTEEDEAPDVVFMDPPRTGSDERFLSALCTMGPKRIVYISCNPETQARDLLYLAKNGYHINVIQPVDMFPFTEHVECITLLTKTRE
ncbi:MAG: 23S rRNA (uracil(1939)-C(5))-methyltransferase RlmD [Pygmaiobacter massiliensis]